MILYIIISIIITFIISWLFFYFIPKGKIYQINQQKIQEEQNVINKLTAEKTELDKSVAIGETQINALNQEIKKLHSDLIEENARLDDARVQNNKLINSMLKDNLSQIQERLDLESEKLSNKYQESEAEYQREYAKMMQELTQEYEKQIGDLTQLMAQADQEYQEAQHRLEELARQVSSAVEANKREEEKRIQADFYRVVIPESDLSEIAKLREVEPYLRDKEALNKVIWKVYYEKPTSDMIGRVVGATEKTGIYKITEIATGKCYVGQAVGISSRWKQHIKRGLGAEAPTRNKLYPAMKSIGVENFTFEIIEECSRGELDEREDFWQEYFHALDFGFSIK